VKCPPRINEEPERLKALSQYRLRVDRELPSLDSVVKIAARMFDMPLAAVNMIDSERVFFAASVGFEKHVSDADFSRDASFCAHAIAQDGVMVVPDALLDERFHDNPLVQGSTRIRFYAGVPLRSPDGYPLGALCVIDNEPRATFTESDQESLRELAQMATDRLELRRIEASMERQTPPAFLALSRHASTPVLCFDEAGIIVSWNAAAATLFGYKPEEGIGNSLDMLLPARDRTAFHSMIEHALADSSLEHHSFFPEASGLRKDGSEFRLHCSLFCSKENGRCKFIGVLSDMTEWLRETDPEHPPASQDVLTQLASRGEYYRKVEEALARSRAATVLLVDLSGFKDVNDTLGHMVGDAILRSTAERLQRSVQPQDVVARIGGDEFAILIRDLGDQTEAAAIAQRVTTEIAKPIVIDGHEFHIDACCGIAVAPTHGHESLKLIGNADLALSRAKANGRGKSFVFVPSLRMEAMERRLYGLELHRAAQDGEFLLFYQPQVRLEDGALLGAEALIRWLHPTRGLLLPAVFLPTLEGGPLAATVGSWVLDEACAQAARWRRNGASEFRVGVNLFEAQFRVGNLVDEVISTLSRHGLPPDALEIEITENIVLDHDEAVLATLDRLRRHGVGIAVDDFGTGYASLSLLKRYPLTRIKIDRSFVQGMLDSPQDTAVIRAVIDMANSFGLRTIAEGIEQQKQQAALLYHGCKEGQGYLFGKPMPPSQFAEAFDIPNHPDRAGIQKEFRQRAPLQG